MSNTPWFRFYNEAINDPKLKRISIMTKQPKALISGVWVGVLCLASESPERGQLLISEDMPYLLEEIIDAVGVDFEIGEFIIDHLLKFGLMNLEDNVYSIAQWDKRQFKSDNSAERVRKHRAKKAQKANNSSDMNGAGGSYYPKRDSNGECNVTETPPDTESDTEIETPTTTPPVPTHSENDVPENSEFSECVKMLNLKGVYLDSFTGQLVQDCYDDISPKGDETKLDWFRYACTEAAGQRAGWKYLEAIIRGVNDSGSLSAHRANRQKPKERTNGQRRANFSQRKTATASPPKRSPYKATGDFVSSAGLPLGPLPNGQSARPN